MSNESQELTTILSNITPELNTSQSMDAQTSNVATVTATSKTIMVEPISEGPLVKAKRVLSPKQLEALKQGRQRLAEKRKLLKVTTSTTTSESANESTNESTKNESNDTLSKDDSDSDSDTSDIDQYQSICSII